MQLTVRDDTGLPEAFDVDETDVAVNAPPVAVAGPDLLVEPGQPVRFDGSGSYDPDGSIAAWRWDFDDLDAPVTTAIAERTFDAPGVHSAQLTVTDASGAANATAAGGSGDPGQPPAGRRRRARDRYRRLYVTLDGSGSSDGDGDQLIHTWDFGDGSPPALGEIVTHAYPRSGVFPVKLTVDDGTGLGNAVAIASTRVLIDARPVAVAGGNRDVCSGDAILFDGSASNDPDGGLLRYDWDFGDGTRADIVNPSKTYEKPGVYPVTLTVRDEFGPADRRAQRPHRRAGARGADRRRRPADPGLHQPDRAARRLGVDRRRRRGQRLLLELRRRHDRRRRAPDPRLRAARQLHRDPDDHRRRPRLLRRARHRRDHGDGGRGAADRDRRPRPRGRGRRRRFDAALVGDLDVRGATFAWDFGDGATATGPTVRHAFAEPGTRTVRLSAELPGASDGCGTIETRRLVTVNAPPAPVIDVPDRIAAGALVLFDAAASPDPDGAVTGFAWDFGDGATATGVQAQHRFAAPAPTGSGWRRPTTPASATAASRRCARSR